MQSITEGENTIDYAYNGDGQRVSKTVNGTKTEYYYNGSILAGQKSGEDTLVFMYDNNSDIFGFIYNGTEYYYIKNAQNDVTAIADKDGNVLVNYTYDAWGKLTEATGNTEIAELNPIRYRSYYYDSETEWYYLNTRYYSADMCRFINADRYVQTGQGILDKNMFAYCGNNPISYADSDGDSRLNVNKSFSNKHKQAKKFIHNVRNLQANINSKSIECAEHHRRGTTNKANQPKHEQGQARKNRDAGGEKGDARRKSRSNKRNRDNSETNFNLGEKFICCAIIVVATVVVICLVADDTTLIGVIDDGIVLPLGGIIWECTSKVLS